MSQTVIVACPHGVDRRFTRCLICSPETEVESVPLEAGPDYTDILLLIAECLIPLAFAASPDGGRRESRLAALRAALEEKP